MLNHITWVQNLVAQQISAYQTQAESVAFAITPELEAEITDTVLQNLHANRAQRVITRYRGGDTIPAFSLSNGFANTPDLHPFQSDLAGYIQQVIQTYTTEHPHVSRLYQSDSDAWNDLHLKLALWARNNIRKNCLPLHLVTDVVQDVCLKVHQRDYPFDTTFDAWAGAVLRNQIRHYARQKDPLFHTNTISLDEPSDFSVHPSQYERICNDQAQRNFAQVDDFNQITYALAELKTEARQEVIWLYYFENRTFAEIAAIMNKSETAIRTLKYRALKELTKYL